jgi:hypothetical protein
MSTHLRESFSALRRSIAQFAVEETPTSPPLVVGVETGLAWAPLPEKQGQPHLYSRISRDKFYFERNFSSRRAASSSVSGFLQKAKRTC